jgi:hypothetical protein
MSAPANTENQKTIPKRNRFLIGSPIFFLLLALLFIGGRFYALSDWL